MTRADQRAARFGQAYQRRYRAPYAGRTGGSLDPRRYRRLRRRHQSVFVRITANVLAFSRAVAAMSEAFRSFGQAVIGLPRHRQPLLTRDQHPKGNPPCPPPNLRAIADTPGRVLIVTFRGWAR